MARDIADRAQRHIAGLADALGNQVGRRENLCRLIVEQQMIIAEMRTRDMPVEILGLEIQRKTVCQNAV